MLKYVVTAAYGAAMMIFAFAGTASAETVNFPSPIYDGNRLDWCLNWGTGCGQQAATAFCRHRGFERATDFGEAHDIGASSPTRLIGTGAVCDQGFCDGFSHITCDRPPQPVVFNNPIWNGNRLDWCLSWGTGCGQQAATAFCQANGHPGGAVAFVMAADIGAVTPTRLISTGAICDQAFCDGFRSITCSP